MASRYRLVPFGLAWLSIAACGNRDPIPDRESAGAGAADEAGGAAGSTEIPAACVIVGAQGQPPLIDDFEDGDPALPQTSNRHGFWYANNDGTGDQFPNADPSGASFTLEAPGSTESPSYALHTTGSGFTSWGAFVSANLSVQTTLLCPYDASTFSGIRFNIKGSGAVRVEIGTSATTPRAYGGQCEEELCSDYGLDVTPGADWAEVRVAFDAIALPSWASVVPWKPDEVMRVSFWVEDGDFDFWLDDIAFF